MSNGFFLTRELCSFWTYLIFLTQHALIFPHDSFLLSHGYHTALSEQSQPIWAWKCHRGKYDHPSFPSKRPRDVRSRFDIYSFGFNTDEDEDGMLKSKRLITQLVTEEVKSGTPASRIFLGGFSQGGAMSLLVGLTGEHKLAALAILSSWLPLRKKFRAVCQGLPSMLCAELTKEFLTDDLATCRFDFHLLGIWLS